jgi:hypothetical protein
MGRPPGRIHGRPFQMRISDEFLASLDRWSRSQPDKPSRAEAIRQLVALGLASAPKPKSRRARSIPVSKLNASNDT